MGVYELNLAIYNLRHENNRTKFLIDRDSYLNSYNLSGEERQLICDADWQGLVDAGVSIYVLTKLASTMNIRFLEMGAKMRGESYEEFRKYLDHQNEQLAGHKVFLTRGEGVVDG